MRTVMEITCGHGEPRGPRFCALCRRAGTTERNEAMERVELAADPDWFDKALTALRQIAQTNPTLTSAEVLIAVGRTGAITRDNRALGPVMKRAQTIGLIEPTGTFVPHPGRHQTPIRVWKSNIYTDGTLTYDES
jgi:hypothetical protein